MLELLLWNVLSLGGDGFCDMYAPPLRSPAVHNDTHTHKPRETFSVGGLDVLSRSRECHPEYSCVKLSLSVYVFVCLVRVFVCFVSVFVMCICVSFFL